MKNIFIIIGLLLLISFTPSVEKTYKFELNEAQLNALWNCLDNSNSPHSTVKQVQEIIQTQLQYQLPKPPVDSMKTKK